MKIIYQCFVIVLFSFLLSACNNRLQFPQHGFTIGFYNVENLFDTIDNPYTDDSDWTPLGKNKWNTERYNHKINQLSRVIASMDSLNPPHIIGLAEVENREVLHDLVAASELESASYNFIHFESKDPRGIEVAMLYQPKYFKPIVEKELKVEMDESRVEMRFVLYVKGIVARKDTLHIFVNHWKSRFGGAKETENKRIRYAEILREKVDSLFRIDQHAHIIICGDLNDNPTDRSVREVLHAQLPERPVKDQCLYNLALAPFLTTGQGTLYYKSWDFFDQIIVSSSLIQQRKRALRASIITITKHPWMLYTYKGEKRPDRTFSGNNYYGGFSDHLPVMIRLKRD